MPVEIRELIIKAVVDNSNSQSNKNTSQNNTPVNTDEIVARCVEQVLEILETKNER
jgi:Family of unknown function (DUF5908)